MSLEDAVNQMELVGHDFFLFHDADTDRPSVVYRRRGWSYGVLHLETDATSDSRLPSRPVPCRGRRECRRHGLTPCGRCGEASGRHREMPGRRPGVGAGLTG